MKKTLYILLFVFGMAFAVPEKTVAVLPTEGGGVLSDNQIDILTGKMREAALKVLPESKFSVLKQETVYNRLGGMENYLKIVCTESNCIMNLGKKAKVDYVAQCRVVQEDGRYWMTAELYEVSSERQLGTFTRDAVTFDGLTNLIDNNVPNMLFEKIPGVSALPQASPDVQPTDSKGKAASFYAALALDVIGAGFLVYGLINHFEANSKYDDYKNLKDVPSSEYDSAWKAVADAQSSRNLFYILGAASLGLGVGVHIVF